MLEDEDMNIYQALTKDYIHGERSELEQHVLDYQKQAQEAGVKEVNVIVSEGEAGETIVKDVIPHVEPDLLIIGSESKKKELPNTLVVKQLTWLSMHLSL